MNDTNYLIICKDLKEVHEVSNIIDAESIILNFIKNGVDLLDIKVYKAKNVYFNVKVKILHEKKNIITNFFKRFEISDTKYIILFKYAKEANEASNIFNVESIILDFVKNGGNISEIKIYKVEKVDINIKVDVFHEKQKLLY